MVRLARPGSAVKRLVALLAAVLGVVGTAAAVTWFSRPEAVEAAPVYRNTGYPFAERAADLVSRMTLEEKVAQLRTSQAPAIPRLGVQQYTYWNEAQHGINGLGADTNPGAKTSGGPKA